MIASDYKCNECKQKFEVNKNSVEDDFPVSNKCPYCNSLDTYRVWGFGDYDVAQGIAGNAKNNYESGLTYFYSTKYGKQKGKTIKRLK